MQDRPTSSELAEAVREFLESEVLPRLEDPRTRFRTLVAANALSILERELSQEERLIREDLERLGRLLGQVPQAPASLEELRKRTIELDRELVRRIRRGEAPEGARAALQQALVSKLEVASPRFLERQTRKGTPG